MKLSYNWLKEYLKCDLTPQEVADAMTAIGIEVDGVEEQEQIPGGLAGVVVAKVLTCEAHPDSDHLHVTTVDAGNGEPVTVVCGAPNVAAGQKVLFAQLGTVLPGDFKIKKSKIRGIESFGMICAEDELGIGTDHAGIMVLPEDTVVGTPAKEYLKLGAVLGVDGPLTYKNNRKTVEVVETVPIESLLVETDAPYLTPVPFRGKPNRSPYVEYVARKVAEIKGMEYGDVARITAENAKRFFLID